MAATALVQRLNHGPVLRTCADGPSFPRWLILRARVVDEHVLRVHEPTSKHTPFVPVRLGPCLALEPQVLLGAHRAAVLYLQVQRSHQYYGHIVLRVEQSWHRSDLACPVGPPFQIEGVLPVPVSDVATSGEGRGRPPS